MTNWRTAFGGDYLSWEDIGDGLALVTITGTKKSVAVNAEDGKVSKEVLVTFDGVLKDRSGRVAPMERHEWGANVTNCELLEAYTGSSDIEDWIGHKVLLHQCPCEAAGKYHLQPSVRVYGGPEIEHDITREITLKMQGGKKRKPFTKVLKSTKPKTPPPTTPAAVPIPEPADDTGTPFDDLPLDDAPGVGSEDGDAAIQRQIETMANEPRITRGMLTRLGALGSQLTAAGIPEDQWRAEIFTLTSGRTTSRKELTEVEAKVLSVNLSGMLEDARAAKVGVA